MYVYSVTTEDLTEQAQVVKRLILAQLIDDGLLTEEEANDWSSTRAVLARTKWLGLWDLVYNRPERTEESKNKIYYDIIKR